MKMNLLARFTESLKKRGPLGVLTSFLMDIFDRIGHHMVKTRDHRGRWRLYGHPGTQDTVVIVLAGYKPYLWPLTLRRISRFMAIDADVCIVTAGKHVPELLQLCQSNHWCYLTTSKNKTGLALNKAIMAHEKAKWVFKLDEDIFISSEFFERMKRGYANIIADGVYQPGFVAPTLNVNGVTYVEFLKRMGCTESYASRFGGLQIACSGIPIHSEPDAAVWIWKKSLPITKTAEFFANSPSGDESGNARLIGTRFSIGAVLLERSFIIQAGGFSSSWREGILGVDESSLCNACVENSRPMFYLQDVFAGHFSFYPQEQKMRQTLRELAVLDPDCFGDVAPGP